MSPNNNPLPAQQEKDKGDAAFKAGDFPSAIGHYSAAIVHDRTDYRLTLNRAAAYLKLGKNEDALRDCTTTLALSPNNPKALFRRSQARVGTGALSEAVEDLKAVLKLQPTDTIITKELDRVLEMSRQDKEKQPKQPIEIPPSSSTKRRRIPITIVEADGQRVTSTPSTPSQPLFEPVKVSTQEKPRSILKKAPPAPEVQEIIAEGPPTKTTMPPPPSPINPPKATVKAPQPVEVPQSKASAPTKSEPAKPVRVGGGIFRANGSQTVFPVRDVKLDTAKASSSTSAKPKAAVVPKMPANLFDLNKIWDMCPTSDDRYHLLTTIPPSQFPAFFQASLEPALLTSILKTFLDVIGSRGDAATKTMVQEYLNALSSVPRLGTLLLFFNPAERDVARNVVSTLDSSKLSPMWTKIL